MNFGGSDTIQRRISPSLSMVRDCQCSYEKPYSDKSQVNTNKSRKIIYRRTCPSLHTNVYQRYKRKTRTPKVVLFYRKPCELSLYGHFFSLCGYVGPFVRCRSQIPKVKGWGWELFLIWFGCVSLCPPYVSLFGSPRRRTRWNGSETLTPSEDVRTPSVRLEVSSIHFPGPKQSVPYVYPSNHFGDWKLW